MPFNHNFLFHGSERGISPRGVHVLGAMSCHKIAHFVIKLITSVERPQTPPVPETIYIRETMNSYTFSM